jgi:hypothetical protein
LKRFLKQHLTTIVVAMITAAVTAGGPAIAETIADFARDSHKVDGLHAVDSTMDPGARAGKLVATNGSGRLPNNIIVKADDAQKLDGLNSTQFMPAVLPSGRLITGDYGAAGGESYFADTPAFTVPLAAPPTDVLFFYSGSEYTQNCPGPGRAAGGWLCIYEHINSAATYVDVFNPRTHSGTASRTGFFLEFQGFSTGSHSYGEYAYRAP